MSYLSVSYYKSGFCLVILQFLELKILCQMIFTSILFLMVINFGHRGRNGYVYETNSGIELYLFLPYDLLELKRLLTIYLQSLSLPYEVVTLSADAENYWILEIICYCDLQNINMCCFCFGLI